MAYFLWSWVAQSERDKPSGMGENYTEDSRHVYLEFVLLAIDDDSGDLLIHEEQDGDQQGWQSSCQVHPPGVTSERWHKPATVWACWLKM